MANLVRLVIAACLGLFAAIANAGYAQMTPPPGWSPGAYAPSANDASYGRVINSPNGPTQNVGGRLVKVPASYRLAANAPRIAAAIIFRNPYVATGVAIASWLAAAYMVWDASQGKWTQADSSYPQSTGVEYKSPASTIENEQWFPTADAAMGHWASIVSSTDQNWTYAVLSCADGLCQIRVVSKHDSNNSHQIALRPMARESGCPIGWFVTPAGCVQNPPPKTVTQEEFEDALAPKPMPDRVPQELPYPSPLPIEYPSPWINPEPGPDPNHRPWFVPTGDPVPNPNYDPSGQPGPDNQPHTQPGVRNKPSPTPAEPWRVDQTPVNRPTPTDQPNPNPENEPGTDPADKPKPEEQQSLCEKHPDIVACKTLGEPPPVTPVPNETKTLSIAPDQGWGEGPGACPAPRTVDLRAFSLSMPFDLLCDFASGLRPVIIGLAWLAAAFTFMGIGRRE